MNAIYLKESSRKIYCVCGLAMIALGLFGLFTGAGSPLFAGVGILQLFMADRSGKVPIIRIEDDHLDIKLAPLASRQLVAYDAIDLVEHASGKIVLHTNGKKVKIPSNTMDDVAWAELCDVLRARVD